jgi:hypothetical protein
LILAGLVAFAPAALARQPSGAGDPAQKSCMRVESDTGHVGGEAVCKTNADWAALKAAGIELDQFGYPLPPKDARDVADHGCTRSYGGGPGKDGTRSSNFDCH